MEDISDGVEISTVIEDFLESATENADRGAGVEEKGMTVHGAAGWPFSVFAGRCVTQG
jgi:hypothetical protein